jgi:hypothetical protein
MMRLQRPSTFAKNGIGGSLGRLPGRYGVAAANDFCFKLGNAIDKFMFGLGGQILAQLNLGRLLPGQQFVQINGHGFCLVLKPKIPTNNSTGEESS